MERQRLHKSFARLLGCIQRQAKMQCLWAHLDQYRGRFVRRVPFEKRFRRNPERSLKVPLTRTSNIRRKAVNKCMGPRLLRETITEPSFANVEWKAPSPRQRRGVFPMCAWPSCWPLAPRPVASVGHAESWDRESDALVGFLDASRPRCQHGSHTGQQTLSLRKHHTISYVVSLFYNLNVWYRLSMKNKNQI